MEDGDEKFIFNNEDDNENSVGGYNTFHFVGRDIYVISKFTLQTKTNLTINDLSHFGFIYIYICVICEPKPLLNLMNLASTYTPFRDFFSSLKKDSKP